MRIIRRVYMKKLLVVILCLPVVFMFSWFWSSLEDSIKDTRNDELKTFVNSMRRGLHDIQNKELKSEFEDKATLILIVGYMRSGSTLMGDILQRAKNMFYVFEPLHDVTEVMLRGRQATFLNGDTKKFNVSDMTNVHTKSMYNWLACNFTSLDLGSLIHSDMLYHSRSTNAYYRCHKNTPVSNLIKRVKDCLNPLMAKCKASSMRTMKSIRISMESVEKLLQKFKNLKVIHLLRDPRAIFHSQIKAKLIGSDELEKQAKEYCERMSADIDTTERLMSNFPHQVKPLIYEIFTDHPIEKTKELYNYLGINYNSMIESHVRDIAVSGKESNCLWCTQKGNSSQTAQKWRKFIDQSHLSITDKYCKYVYDKIGYIQTNDIKYIRNMSKPLRRGTSFGSNAL